MVVNFKLCKFENNLKLKNMKEYFLKVSRTKKGDINLNGSYLSVWENDNETILIDKIQQPTEKGWKSNKVIIEHLDIIYQESEVDLIITEECANMLIEKYKDVKVKIWDNAPSYIYETIAERNEVKYGDGVNMEYFK